MRRTEMMTAGGATLAGLGVIVGLAIGSGEGKPKALAQSQQPVEVRTQIIRKTVHVYKREHPHPAAGGRASSPGTGEPAGAVGSGILARTRSSGASGGSAAGAAAPGVRTRTSGTAAPVRGSGGSSRPVRTASSGTRTSSGSPHAGSGSRPVSTRTSGATHSSGPVKTRTSGHGGDGGDGGGHDN